MSGEAILWNTGENSSPWTKDSFPDPLSFPGGQTPWADSERHTCGLLPRAWQTLIPCRGRGGPLRVTLGVCVCAHVCAYVGMYMCSWWCYGLYRIWSHWFIREAGGVLEHSMRNQKLWTLSWLCTPRWPCRNHFPSRCLFIRKAEREVWISWTCKAPSTAINLVFAVAAWDSVNRETIFFLCVAIGPHIHELIKRKWMFLF